MFHRFLEPISDIVPKLNQLLLGTVTTNAYNFYRIVFERKLIHVEKVLLPFFSYVFCEDKEHERDNEEQIDCDNKVDKFGAVTGDSSNAVDIMQALIGIGDEYG